MNEQLFCIIVPDFAAPSFITADKPCYGTREDIRAFVLANSEEQKELEELNREYGLSLRGITEPDGAEQSRAAELLYSEEAMLTDRQWEHLNVWGFTYLMKCRQAVTRHFWIRDGEKYLRCVKARLYGLMDSDGSERDRWTDMGERIWGYPHLIEYRADENMFVNTLAETEKYFDTLEEAQADHERFVNAPDPIFTEFCKDIFADG